MALSLAAATALGALGAAGIGAISSGIQNNQNLKYQRENLDYQKALQEKIFQREDTAIQRRKQDLLNAGFNPYMAMSQNGAGSGSVVSTSPMQSNFNTGLISSGLNSAIDTYKAIQEAKQSALQTEYMKYNLWSEFSFNDPIQNFSWDWKKNEATTTLIDNYRLPKNPNELKNSIAAQLRIQELLYAKAQKEGLDISNDILRIEKQFEFMNKISDLIFNGVKAYKDLRMPYMLKPKFDRR